MRLKLQADTQSSLFNGILATIPTPYMQPADAIPLDTHSNHLAHFLDAYNTGRPAEYFSLSFREIHHLRKLLLHLDCDRLIRDITKPYSKACELYPVDQLAAASDEDDVKSACTALKGCRLLNPIPVDTVMSSIFISLLRASWQGPL